MAVLPTLNATSLTCPSDRATSPNAMHPVASASIHL